MMNESLSRATASSRSRSPVSSPADEDADRANGVKSVEKAAGLLRALAKTRGPLRLVDLAAAAGMSRSMARAYLISLVRCGLVRQNPDTGHYDLGSAAVDLGFAALSRVESLQLGRDALRDLVERVRETAILTVWNAHGPVVVAKIDGPRTPVYEIRIGAHVSLQPTSTGHVFMAYLDKKVWEPVVDQVYGSGAIHPKSLTEKQVDRVVRQVRKSGLSIVQATATVPGFGGMSAPVFNQEGLLHAAITLIAPTTALDWDSEGPAAMELRRCAEALSRQLGYRQLGA